MTRDQARIILEELTDHKNALLVLQTELGIHRDHTVYERYTVYADGYTHHKADSWARALLSLAGEIDQKKKEGIADENNDQHEEKHGS